MKEQDERRLKSKEGVLGKEICDAINADVELKRLFTKATGKILSDFAVSEVKAHKTLDMKEGQAIMQKAVNLLKALTMHVCIKVIIKREAK